MTLVIEAVNAYYRPLLKLHDAGSKVTYEDLISSLEAAKKVLAESPNEFVLVSLEMKINSPHASIVVVCISHSIHLIHFTHFV